MANLVRSVAIVGAASLVLAMASPALADNVLVNPGFEDFHEDWGPRPTGWGYWDNVYTVEEADGGPAHSGARKLKMFGNWGWPWNVAGVNQVFPSAEGDVWRLRAFVKQTPGDEIVGTLNYVVAKMEFQDAANNPVGYAEATIVDGSSVPGDWAEAEPVIGEAPPGTDHVVALFLFLQPDYEGGSVLIDDATFEPYVMPVPAVSEWGLVILGLLLLAGGKVYFSWRKAAA
jgi:hypothetical protein